MNKFHVVIDDFNTNFPTDNSVLSLTGISKIVVSNIYLNQTTVMYQLIGVDFKKNETRILQPEQDRMIIQLDYPRKWDKIIFLRDPISEGEASFDLELISCY